MSWTFSVEDIFAVGLGFDIAGGYLLALGLLATPTQIGHSATIAGQAMVGGGKLRDRVDAEIGLSFLIGGFLLQAVGYVVQEAGVKSGPTGLGPAVLFALFTAVSVGVGLAVHRLIAPRRRFAMARATALTHRARSGDLPDGQWLAHWGALADRPALAGETQGEYSKRVFGIEPVYEPDEPVGR